MHRSLTQTETSSEAIYNVLFRRVAAATLLQTVPSTVLFPIDDPDRSHIHSPAWLDSHALSITFDMKVKLDNGRKLAMLEVKAAVVELVIVSRAAVEKAIVKHRGDCWHIRAQVTNYWS